MSVDSQKNCPISKTTDTSSSTPTHPKASYAEVVADERVFMETLEDLHQSLGTKLMIPTIGRRPLDLHRLFVEVTCRGGLWKVIADCKWKDVSSAFDFPPTTTSASFLLRKYYIASLQIYEQVYFFQQRFSKLLLGDANTTTVIKNAITHQLPAQMIYPSTRADYHVTLTDANATTVIKNAIKHQMPDAKTTVIKNAIKHQIPDANTTTMIKDAIKHQIPVQPTLRVGCKVKGKINGKFEYGYIITANSGSETLNGVLYHPPLLPPQKAKVSPPAVSRGQKRRRKDTNPSTVTSNLGGYNIFFVEQYSKLRPLYSGKEKVIANKIFTHWGNLTEFEKEVYKQRDKERRIARNPM